MFAKRHNSVQTTKSSDDSTATDPLMSDESETEDEEDEDEEKEDEQDDAEDAQMNGVAEKLQTTQIRRTEIGANQSKTADNMVADEEDEDDDQEDEEDEEDVLANGADVDDDDANDDDKEYGLDDFQIIKTIGECVTLNGY